MAERRRAAEMRQKQKQKELFDSAFTSKMRKITKGRLAGAAEAQAQATQAALEAEHDVEDLLRVQAQGPPAALTSSR